MTSVLLGRRLVVTLLAEPIHTAWAAVANEFDDNHLGIVA